MLSSAGLFYGDIAVPFRNSTGFQRRGGIKEEGMAPEKNRDFSIIR
jgi:hypothetical protein